MHVSKEHLFKISGVILISDFFPVLPRMKIQCYSLVLRHFGASFTSVGGVEAEILMS